MAENDKVFDGQNDYGWGLTLNMTHKAPAISKRIFNKLEDALEYANNPNSTAIPGLLLCVIKEDENNWTKNGTYFLKKIGDGTNDNKAELIKMAYYHDYEDLKEQYERLLERVGGLENAAGGSLPDNVTITTTTNGTGETDSPKLTVKISKKEGNMLEKIENDDDSENNGLFVFIPIFEQQSP